MARALCPFLSLWLVVTPAVGRAQDDTAPAEEAAPAEETAPAEEAVPAEEAEPAADDGGLIWRDHYRGLHWADYVVAGAFTTGFILVEVYMEGSEEPNWDGSGPVDDWVRGWIRLRSADGRQTAAVASDVLWYTASAWPLVDAFFAAGVANRRWDITWQLTVMWAEGTAIAGFFSRLTQRGFKRARPLVQECSSDPEYSSLCFTTGANSSFMSGHTAGAMVAAGQTCAVHQYLRLYGSELGGALACAGNVTLGLVAGALRMASDRHWFTDVVVGGAFGFAVGYLIPWLHYGRGAPEEPSPAAARATILPWANQTGMGLGAVGYW